MNALVDKEAKESVYFEMVDEFAKIRKDKDISNGKAEHAAYLIAKLIEVAESTVKLYSDRLIRTVKGEERDNGNTDVHLYRNESVLNNVRDFLSREGTRLDIVVENGIENLNEHQLLSLVRKMKREKSLKGQFTLKKIEPEVKEYLENNNFGMHFMVSDDSAFRMEINDSPTNYQAIANFGNKEFSKKLGTTFENIHFKFAEEIII